MTIEEQSERGREVQSSRLKRVRKHATSQGVLVASRSHKNQESLFSPRAPKREASLPTESLVEPITYRTVR